MRKFTILLLLFSNCCCMFEKKFITHYRLNGIVVSRYDEGKKSYFYYGYCNSVVNITQKASVMVDWQFDDFLQASLIFHKDGSVEMLNDGGGSYKNLKTNKIYYKHYESREYNRIKKPYLPPNSLNNLCRLSDDLSYEIRENKRLKSDVSINNELETDNMNCK